MNRIRYLQKRLPVLKVVSEAPANQAQVFFGARVTLENEAGDTVKYRIVGPDELTRPDAISIDSPLARALLKKTIDDEVAVRTERGLVRYWILEIDYRR